MYLLKPKYRPFVNRDWPRLTAGMASEQLQCAACKGSMAQESVHMCKECKGSLHSILMCTKAVWMPADDD